MFGCNNLYKANDTHGSTSFSVIVKKNVNRGWGGAVINEIDSQKWGGQLNRAFPVLAEGWSWTKTLIILDITKTESDNGVIMHCFEKKNDNDQHGTQFVILL